jgi:hypothetical protein
MVYFMNNQHVARALSARLFVGVNYGSQSAVPISWAEPAKQIKGEYVYSSLSLIPIIYRYKATKIQYRV